MNIHQTIINKEVKLKKFIVGTFSDALFELS